VRRSLFLVVLAGCGGGPDPHPEPMGAPATAEPPAAKAPPKADEWDCTGNIVPPAGYVTATATAADSTGAERAALDTLRGKVCGAGGCGELAAELKVWKTGQGGGQACAMAVVNRQAVEQWRGSQDTSTLDAQLTAAARELGGKIKQKAPKIFVARIVDGGAVGGPRARWLLPRLRRAFSEAGAVPVSWEGWSGKEVPPGVDGVVEASLTPRIEKGVPVIELVVEMMHKVGGVTARQAAAPVLFPAAVAPEGGPALPPLPSDPGLLVRFESGEGGVFCAGATTRLALTADTGLHVRAFSLYGDGEALLIHPAAAGQDEVVAGKITYLGGEAGFELLPVPGHDTERVLVVAAKSEADLGELAKYTSPCRLPPGLAGRLNRFEGLPAKARASADGYRIVEGDGCPSLDPAARDRIRTALAEVPECR